MLVALSGILGTYLPWSRRPSADDDSIIYDRIPASRDELELDYSAPSRDRFARRCDDLPAAL